MLTISIIIGDISKGNGTERAVTNLANSLCIYGGYKVNIISCNTKEDSMPYFELHRNIVVYHIGTEIAKKLNYFFLLDRIKDICKETKTDILIGTSHGMNCVIKYIKIKGIKKIACEHMPYHAAPFYSRIIRRLVYPRLDAVVVLTENDKKHYSFCKNIYVIPNSIKQQSLSSSCENSIILAIGRFTEQKGFDLLIKAFSLINESIPEWKLRIVGQGEDEQKLREIIEDHNLNDRLELIPPTKKIENEYLNAGIFVLSSRFEGFGLVLAEAKSFGLPTISFNCSYGPSDIINDGVDGYLVPPENIEELSQQIVKLAKDTELRKKFGRAAKEDIKRFSPQEVFNLWNKIFLEG